jgi:hypothetical protein
MIGNLYIDSGESEGLEEFASRLFALLNLASFEVRYSDNYFGGKYVLGYSLLLGVKVTLADNSEHPDYRYQLTFEPPREQWGTADRKSLDGLADLLARSLALQGWRIARPLGSPRTNEPIMFYRKRATGTESSNDQIEVWREETRGDRRLV